jgi:hypothetical protein
MKILTSLIVVGAVWGGYEYASRHHAAHALQEVLDGADAHGFVDVPPPANQRPDTIYVIAAQNCPREAAQQADRLAKELAAEGLPVVRASQVYYQMRQVDRATTDRLTAVMTGPLPLVFFHARAAMNPALDQVVEEYHSPGSPRTPR